MERTLTILQNSYREERVVSIDKHRNLWDAAYLVGEVRVCSPLQEQCHNVTITPVGCLVQSSAIVLEGKYTYKFRSG